MEERAKIKARCETSLGGYLGHVP